MRGFGLPIPRIKQQPHTVYCIYAPLNAEHEYAYDAGAIVVYLRGMKNRQISHLKKTIITPFEPRYSNRPDGAVCYKRKKALDVCIVKGTAATPCRRFSCLSATKLIRYYNKNKFFTKNFQSISVHFLTDCRIVVSVLYFRQISLKPQKEQLLSPVAWENGSLGFIISSIMPSNKLIKSSLVFVLL